MVPGSSHFSSTADVACSILHVDATLYYREELIAKLGVRANASDAELILAAYARWGRDCPHHIVGDFAFVIEDSERQSIFAARDHIGVRPLHYTVEGGAIRFAASISEILGGRDEAWSLDQQVVVTKLVYRGFSHPSRTYYSDIRKLPPGHWLEFSQGDLRVQRYWHAGRIAPLRRGDDADHVERGRELFREAVRQRAMAAGRIGVHVSGGLDSSAIAAIATQLRRAAGLPDPIGFAWQDWRERASDGGEASWIAAMQRELSIEVHSAVPTPRQAREMFEIDMASDFDVGNCIHEAIVMEQASELGITTILSGWGGDEFLTFNGRGMARHLLRTGQLRRLKNLSGRGGLRGLAAGFVMARNEKTVERGVGDLAGKRRKSLVAPEMLASTELLEIEPLVETDPRSAQLSLLASGHVTARLEDWAACGARHNVRYAYPMLDRRVMEFALSVPVELFRRGPERRWLFREMMRGILPEEVRTNASKMEPARVSAVMNAVHEAMAGIGRDLGEPSDYRRARFIDMDRLKRQLGDGGFERIDNFAHLRLALQFLDI